MKHPLSKQALSAPLLALAVAACGSPPPPEEPRQTPDERSHPPALPYDRKSKTPPNDRTPLVPKDLTHAPNGDMASFSGTEVRITRASGVGFYVDTSVLHPPAGEKTLLRIAPTALAYVQDGLLFVGTGDGTVTAVDASGRRLFSVGLRGAVKGFALTGGGLVAVTTDRGVLALLGTNGEVRWERQITAEPLSAPFIDGPTVLTASQRGVFAYAMTGEPRYTHASSSLQVPCVDDERNCHEDTPPAVWTSESTVEVDTGLQFDTTDPHPPVASLTPTFPLTFRKVLDGAVVSLIPSGSTEISALVTKRAVRNEYDWDTDDKYDVVQLGGSRIKRMRVPDVASKSEVFVDGTRAAPAAVFVDALVQGPNGNPWVLARKINAEKTSTGDGLLGLWGGAGQIYEVTGGKVQERTELFKTFAAHWLSTGIVGAPSGTANLLCFGEEDSTCTVHTGATFRLLEPPAKVESLSHIGDALWAVTADGDTYRIDAKTHESFGPTSQPEDTPFRAVAGVTEKDVWANFRKRYALLHHDGATWKEVAIPVVGDTLVVRAPDDAWSGRSRWDGMKWSLVHGAPPATAVLAKSKDDVWLGDTVGLWHGTAPGPSPVQLPPIAATGDAAAPDAAPLPLGPADTRLVAVRANVPVPGEAPLEGASNVAAAPDGTLWMLAPDRLVEVASSGKGTTVRWMGRETFGKWAVPEARGKGLFLHRDEARGIDHRDEVRALDGNSTAPADIQLDRQDLVAASAIPGGTAWILGAPADFDRSPQFRYKAERLHEKGISAWEEFAPHALVRVDKGPFRPVLGLPAAAWCDVATGTDGGAWFAGALSKGPSGEGILFHAAGPLGVSGTTRFRAAATLFAVASVAPDEAWAVGAAGTILHVKGTRVTRYSLPSGEWLRSVYATAPDDIWIGGDGGTLLHGVAGTFHPVTHPLGANATVTGITSSRGAIWAVGPAGILKLQQRP